MAASAQPAGANVRHAAQEFIGRHWLPPGALQLQEPHRTGAAGDRQSVVEYAARRTLARALRCAQNLDASGAGQFRPRAGKGREAAAMVMDLLPRPLPVDARLVLADLAGVGHARSPLRGKLQRSFFE